MSTLMLCPTCKGVMGDSRASGKRCTCSSPGVASFTASGPKLCSVCGTDVTDKKRMKDGATGRYWCYDCFIIEQRKKSSGMTMRCAKCHKDCPPVRMIKHGETWWCDACDANDPKAKKAKKPESTNGKTTAEEKSKSPLLVGGVVVALIAVAAYYVMNM
jgi:hypothetical protein